MAKSIVLPRLDLSRGSVPQLQSGNTGNQSGQDEPVRDVVPQHSGPILSNRDESSDSTGLPEARKGLQESKRIHIALVVPDIKIFGRFKNSVYVLKPQDHEDDILVHVLLQRKDQTHEEILFAFALTQLGLVEPSVAKLQYPEEIELGWSNHTAPINEEENGIT